MTTFVPTDGGRGRAGFAARMAATGRPRSARGGVSRPVMDTYLADHG